MDLSDSVAKQTTKLVGYATGRYYGGGEAAVVDDGGEGGSADRSEMRWFKLYE